MKGIIIGKFKIADGAAAEKQLLEAVPSVAAPSSTYVPVRLERSIVEKHALAVNLENAAEKIRLAKKCNEELWAIPEKGREKLLGQMGYTKEQIKYYMGGLDYFNDYNNAIITQAKSIVKNGATVKDPKLREAMTKSANALAGSILVAYTPYILWKAKEARASEAAKALTQLEDAHSYVAYAKMFNLYSMKGDINGKTAYVAETNGGLEARYYRLLEAHPSAVKAKSLDSYRKAVDEFYKYHSEYSQKQMASFQSETEIGKARGLEKARLIASPYMEASVPLLAAGLMGVGGPGGFALGAFYFGNQAKESFGSGHYITGSLISLTLMTPFFSALRATPVAAARTAGRLGGAASAGAGLVFQVGMAKDAFSIVFDASRTGWTSQDAAALMNIGGFMAMPLASARAAKAAGPKEGLQTTGFLAAQPEPIGKPRMKMADAKEGAGPKESGGTNVQLSEASLKPIRDKYGSIVGIMEMIVPALADAVAKESDKDSIWGTKKSAESFAEELCAPDAVKAAMTYKNNPEVAATVVLQFLHSAQYRRDVNEAARNLSRKEVVDVLGRIRVDIKTAEGIAKLFASTNDLETRACCRTIMGLLKIPGALEGVVDSFPQALAMHWPRNLEGLDKPEVMAALSRYAAVPEAARTVAYSLTEAVMNSRDLTQLAVRLAKPEVVRAITALGSVPEAAEAMAGSFAALAARSEGNPVAVAKKILDPKMDIDAIVRGIKGPGVAASLKRDIAIYLFGVSYKPSLVALTFEICGEAGKSRGRQTGTAVLSDVARLMKTPQLADKVARAFPALANGKVNPEVIAEGLKKFDAPDRQKIMSEYFHLFFAKDDRAAAKENGLREENLAYERWAGYGPVDWDFKTGYEAWARVLEVEGERPGICSALYKQNGIRFFERYSMPTLLRIYDNLGKRKKGKPVLLVFTGVADHNGAFKPKPVSMLQAVREQDIIGDFWKDFDVHIVEAGSRYEAARRIIGISNTYGKPKVLYFNAHGNVDRAKLGWKEDEVVNVKGLVSGADLSRYFDERPTVVLASCSTGAKGGFAEQTQARFGNTLMYAPKIPTATNSVKFLGMTGGWAIFDVAYAEGDITAEFTPKNKQVGSIASNK